MAISPPSLSPATQIFPVAAPPTWVDPVEAHPYEDAEPDLDRESWKPSGLLEWFAIGQTALPALLYLPGNQQFRFAIRAGAFLVSIAALLYWWVNGRRRVPVRHHAIPWLMIVLMILGIQLANPGTETMRAGVGQIALYVAVLSPLFWVPAFVTDRRTLIRVLAVLLVCNGINSLVGVLQVYDPGSWMPKEFSSIYAMNRDVMATSVYMGPNGRLIVRPPGLYDTPGAVCGAGTLAALLGVIFFMQRMQWWKRLLALAFATAGLAAIYLSHVRSSLMVLVGMVATYAVLLVIQRQKVRALGLLGLAAALLVGALAFAVVLGGNSVQARFSTVLEENPAELYYKNRGNQVQFAMTEAARQYPFGAGLARWGVMSGYLGVPTSSRIGAEVQPLAWILDGGLSLVFAYGFALLATVVWGFRTVWRLRDPNDRLWAAAVVAANVGTLALVLTFVPFATQIGIQFWFLEGLLHGAMTMKMQAYR